MAAGSRIFGHDERTIQRWLTRVAQHSQRLHQHYFRNLVCQHLQLDELVIKVRGAAERVFVWVALDAQTKIIPVIHIGGRKRTDAMAFVHEVWQRLAPSCVPIFTTVGLWLYYYALTAISALGCRRQAIVGPSGRSRQICCMVNCTKSK